MLYLVDEETKGIDIVEEYNKYIDMIGMITEDGSFYTPEVLVDPDRFINEIDDPERYTLVPLMAYCDIYTVCYGDGNCYLVPIKENVEIDITAGRGITVLRKDGTLIVPKRGHSPRVGQMSIADYEECINGNCDKDFKDLLERIKFWTERDIQNAIADYRKLQMKNRRKCNMTKGQVLKIEDNRVNFKKVKFNGDECFFTNAILGLQNYTKEAKKAKETKHLPESLSDIFDVYIESITKIYDMGYIAVDPNSGKYMFISADVVFYILGQIDEPVNITYEYEKYACLNYNGSKIWFVGTIIGKDLPDDYESDDSAMYIGRELNPGVAESLDNGSPFDKVLVIEKIIDTYRKAIEGFKHYSLMLEFFHKELTGEDARKEVGKMIDDMMKDDEGREMLSNLFMELFSNVNK